MLRLEYKPAINIGYCIGTNSMHVGENELLFSDNNGLVAFSLCGFTFSYILIFSMFIDFATSMKMFAR